jgi:hypothetical protein
MLNHKSFLFVITLFFLFSCDKEEGNKTIIGAWNVEKAHINKVRDEYTNYSVYRFEFAPSGKYDFYMPGYVTGTYELSEDGRKMILDKEVDPQEVGVRFWGGDKLELIFTYPETEKNPPSEIHYYLDRRR